MNCSEYSACVCVRVRVCVCMCMQAGDSLVPISVDSICQFEVQRTRHQGKKLPTTNEVGKNRIEWFCRCSFFIIIYSRCLINGLYVWLTWTCIIGLSDCFETFHWTKYFLSRSNEINTNQWAIHNTYNLHTAHQHTHICQIYILHIKHGASMVFSPF